MRWKILWGIGPALLYIAVAITIVSKEFNCFGGLDINICGLGTALITAPSYFTLGLLFRSIGWQIDFTGAGPDIVDIVQLTIHIALCALLVFLLGYAFGWAVRKLQVRSRKARVPSSISGEDEVSRVTGKPAQSPKIFKF
jgi:hypothetical protein